MLGDNAFGLFDDDPTLSRRLSQLFIDTSAFGGGPMLEDADGGEVGKPSGSRSIHFRRSGVLRR